MRHFPNADAIECSGPGLGAGCMAYNTSANLTIYRCEASGHTSCNQRSQSGQLFNAFGNSVQSVMGGGSGISTGGKSNGGGNGGGGSGGVPSQSSGWNPALCGYDSDGDGASNGDELGDPCCCWTAGQPLPPVFFADATHPQDAAISPSSRPVYTGAPPAPQPVAMPAGPGAVSFSWAPTPRTCQFVVTVNAVGGGVAKSVVVPGNTGVGNFSILLCELTAGSSYTATVQAASRTGVSTTITVPITAGSSGITPTTGCYVSSATSYINTAGTVPTVLSSFPAAVAVAAPVIAVVLVLLTACLARKSSPVERVCARRPCGGCCLGGGWLGEMPWTPVAYPAALAVLVASVAVLWSVTAEHWFLAEMYSFGEGFPVYRAAGYALATSIGLQLLPVTRRSPLLWITTISFERALWFHRLLGVLTVALTLVHGVGMLVEFSRTPLGFSYAVSWISTTAVNPLAGLIAGVFLLIMGFAALPWIRRNYWTVFRALHFLWPLVILFSALHTIGSATPVLPLFALGLILLAIDLVLHIGDVVLRPSKLLASECTVLDGAGITRLVFSKGTSSLWPFVFRPGQFMWVWAPRLSLFPHPFSISRPQDTLRPDLVSVHVKGMSAGRFTQRLAAVVGEEAMPRLHPVYVLGPFGRPSVPLEEFHHFVLIAGGVGITAIAPLHASIVNGLPLVHADASPVAVLKRLFSCHHRAPPLAGAESPRPDSSQSLSPLSGTQSGPSVTVTTAWVVREPALIAEFAPLLPTSKSGRVAAEVSVWGGRSEAKKGGGKSAAAASLAQLPGRPDLVELLRTVAARATSTQSQLKPGGAAVPVRVCMVVCGPAPLVADAMHAAALAGGGGVEFAPHRETFAL